MSSCLVPIQLTTGRRKVRDARLARMLALGAEAAARLHDVPRRDALYAEVLSAS